MDVVVQGHRLFGAHDVVDARYSHPDEQAQLLLTRVVATFLILGRVVETMAARS